ncbi:MAG: hypothetical protein JNL89_12630, partial [Rhodanobacteraceae bacterium]|nr:hypothetical protein [Rhodanobacteraceae bacterium]
MHARAEAPAVFRSGLPASAAILLFTAVVLALLGGYTRVELPQPHLRPASVERFDGPGTDRPPPQAAGWTAVALPDRAPLRPGERDQRAWYRLRFAVGPPPASLQALLLRRPLAALQIFVDGTELGDSGVSRRPLPVYRSDLRYNLPPALWTPPQIEVWVLSVSRQGRAGLGEVLIGDSAALAAYKAERNWLDKTIPGHSVLISALLAIAFAAVWAARPRESAFGWLAAALAGRALFTQLGVQQTPWFDWPELYRCLIYLALLAFIYCELEFSRVLLQLHNARAERRVRPAFALIALVLVGLSLAGSAAHQLVGALLAVPAALAVGATVVWRFARHARAHPESREVRWLLILAGVLLLVG